MDGVPGKMKAEKVFSGNFFQRWKDCMAIGRP